MKNNKSKVFITVLLFLIPFVNHGFGDSLNYVSPVDHTIRLAGNFMEIRGNHFHAGIDIKSSKGKIGDAIYSIGDGYISRIKVQSGGYGNVLYIDHPEGHTSVYAHLNNFSEEVSRYVKDMQYAIESFEIDIYLPDSMFLVSQKEQIGEMGITGRSFGPHLHFELRKTESENPINPEKFGIGPLDSRPPVFESLHLYNLDEDASVTKEEIRYFNPNKEAYKLYTNVLEIDSERIGIGLQMFDRMDGSSNKNGVYGYRLFVDDELSFSWQANEFSFNQDVLLKGFIDFKKNVASSRKVYLLYRQTCNNFSYFGEGKNGIIEIPQGSSKNIRIEAYDLYDNISSTQFNIKSKGDLKQNTKLQTPCDSSQIYNGQYFNVDIPAKTLFGAEDLNFVESVEVIKGQTCPFISIADHLTAVKNYYKISVVSNKIQNFNKLTLAGFDKKGRMIHFGLEHENSNHFSMINECGEFFLYRDIEKPIIQIVRIGKDKNQPWMIKINDNLIPSGTVDDLDYQVMVNGRWLRMQYDKKSDMLYFDDFERLPSGQLDISISVKDYCGNEAREFRVLN